MGAGKSREARCRVCLNPEARVRCVSVGELQASCIHAYMRRSLKRGDDSTRFTSSTSRTETASLFLNAKAYPLGSAFFVRFSLISLPRSLSFCFSFWFRIRVVVIKLIVIGVAVALALKYFGVF